MVDQQFRRILFTFFHFILCCPIVKCIFSLWNYVCCCGRGRNKIMPPKNTRKRQNKKHKANYAHETRSQQTKLNRSLKGGGKGLKQVLLPYALEPPPVKRRPGSNCEDLPNTKSTKTPTSDESGHLEQSSLKRRHDQEKDEDCPKLKLIPASNVDNELQSGKVTFDKTCKLVLEDCTDELQENHASLDISNEEPQMELSTGTVGTNSTSNIERANCTVKTGSIVHNTDVGRLKSSTAPVVEKGDTSGVSLMRAPLRNVSQSPPKCAQESCSDACEKKPNGTYYRYCSLEHSKQNGKKRRKRKGKRNGKGDLSSSNQGKQDGFLFDEESFVGEDDTDQHGSEISVVANQPSVAKQLSLNKHSSVHNSTTVTKPNVSREETAQNVPELSGDLVCMGCDLLLTHADQGDGDPTVQFCVLCRQVQEQILEESSNNSNGKEETPNTSERKSPRKKSAESFYGVGLNSSSKQHQRKCQFSHSPQPQQGKNGQGVDTLQQLERSSLGRSERISHSTPSTGSKRSRRGKTGPIRFYHKSDPYFEFTNFHVSPIEVDGKIWATTENYFQAQKYIGTPLYDAIQECGTAREAFTTSRSPQGSRWRRSDWEEVKQDVMYVALYAKFTQHGELKKKLLGTGDRPLVEHTERDRYWGDGGDGRGENHLGKLLMKLRKELIEEEKDKSNKEGETVRRRKKLKP